MLSLCRECHQTIALAQGSDISAVGITKLHHDIVLLSSVASTLRW